MNGILLRGLEVIRSFGNLDHRDGRVAAITLFDLRKQSGKAGHVLRGRFFGRDISFSGDGSAALVGAGNFVVFRACNRTAFSGNFDSAYRTSYAVIGEGRDVYGRFLLGRAFCLGYCFRCHFRFRFRN